MPSDSSSPTPPVSPTGEGGSATPPVALTDPRAKHLSAMGHDLRGSIGGLLLLNDLLRADLAPAGSAAAMALADVDSLRSGLLDLLGSVERHICIERFRLGLIHPRPAPIDLTVLARDLRDRYTPFAAERGFTLEVTGTGTAHTDRVLLTVAAAALLDNILKHAEPPLARLTLAGQSAASDADSATWSVRAESTGALAPAVVAQLSHPPSADEFVVNAPGGLGLRLIRAIAATVGGEFRRLPTGQDHSLSLQLSGKTL